LTSLLYFAHDVEAMTYLVSASVITFRAVACCIIGHTEVWSTTEVN